MFNIVLFLTVLSAPQYTPDTNNGQLPEDSSSSVPSLDVSVLDDYYTDNGEKKFYLSLDNKTFSKYFKHWYESVPRLIWN